MFYILSRLLACLASPVLYLIVILLAALFAKNVRFKAVMIVLFVVLLGVTTNKGVYGRAERAWCGECLVDVDTTSHYDFAIIPGGVTCYDSIRHRVEYGEASDRIVDCAWLMNVGIVDKMIITGDGASNAAGDSLFFRRHMKDVYSIDGDRVLIEPRAKNTIENFTKTLEQFGDQLAGKKILVINSAMYMRRTMLCCDKVGLDCDYYTVDINTSWPSQWEDWIPDFGLLDKWMKLAHEWIGYVAYLLY